MTPANLENLGLRQLDSSSDGHGFRSLVPLSIKSGGEDETPIFRHANRCRKLAAAFAHGYITLPTVPLFNLRGGDFTLGVFVKAGPGNLNWFTKGNSLGNNMGEHRYGLGGGKTISFSFDGGAGGHADNTTIVFDLVWHHVAGVKRGTTAEIWIDGRRENIAPITGSAEEGSFSLGRMGACCESFNGQMADAKIWNRALSGEEIATEAEQPSRR